MNFTKYSCVCLLLSWGVQCYQKVLNAAVDITIHYFTQQLPDFLTIPSIVYNRFFYFQTGNGSVGNLHSLRRAGDFLLKTDTGDRINGTHDSSNTEPIQGVLKVDLGKTTLTFDFYQLKLLRFSTYGTIFIEIEKIQVEIHSKLIRHSVCLLSVDSIEFNEFGPFDIRVQSTCTVCNTIVSNLMTYFVNLLNVIVKQAIKDIIHRTIKEQILAQNNTLCIAHNFDVKFL